MEPDGKLIIRLAASLDSDMQPTTLEIPFSAMRRWEPMQQCLSIVFDDRRVLIPWWNVLDVECRFNSPEYVQEHEAHRIDNTERL